MTMRESIPDFAPVLAQALLHFVWQALLLGAVAALALHFMRHARAKWRYAFCCVALLVCSILPVVTIAIMFVMEESTGLQRPMNWVNGMTIAQPLQFALDKIFQVAIGSNSTWLIVGIWTLGFSFMVLRFYLGILWIRGLQSTAPESVVAHWQQRLNQLAVRCGVRQVELRLVEDIDSPFAAGWWRPIVFLPVAMLTQMPVNLIEALLAHELAHIRRHDFTINLMQRLIEAVLFYHPVVWWLSGRIRIERELVADNICAHMLGTPLPLARALVVLAENQRGRASVYGGLVQPATGGVLLARIESLVRPTAGKPFWASDAGWLSIGFLAVVVACYGSWQLATDPQRIQNPFNVHVARDFGSSSAADPACEAIVLLGGDAEPSLFWGDSENVDAANMHRRTGSAALWVRLGGRAYLVTEPRLVNEAASVWREAKSVTLQIDALDGKLRARHFVNSLPDAQVLLYVTQLVQLRMQRKKLNELAAQRTHVLISEAIQLGLAESVTIVQLPSDETNHGVGSL